MVLITAAFSSIPIQNTHGQASEQQKPAQLDNCKNNATCTYTTLISFITSNLGKNDTKTNFDAGQANLIKGDATPFLLPFP